MKQPSQAIATLANHVRELRGLHRSAKPGTTKDRLKARYDEAQKALKEQREKDGD